MSYSLDAVVDEISVKVVFKAQKMNWFSVGIVLWLSDRQDIVFGNAFACTYTLMCREHTGWLENTGNINPIKIVPIISRPPNNVPNLPHIPNPVTPHPPLLLRALVHNPLKNPNNRHNPDPNRLENLHKIHKISLYDV